MSDTLFEQATRLQLRFESARGALSVEDIWRLPLSELDTLAIAANKRFKESQEESFIAKPSDANKLLELKLNVLKHIISVKLDEQEQAKARAEKNARRDQIQQALAERRNEDLKSKSAEELQAMLDSE